MLTWELVLGFPPDKTPHLLLGRYRYTPSQCKTREAVMVMAAPSSETS